MARQDWIPLVRHYSKVYGVDGQAALAVAAMEGLSGRVGDQGTSFGPFQLHVGGALPAGKGRAWAESPAGIEYAIRKMSEVARGLQGADAVRAIVSKFERPANPGKEIAGALEHLGSPGTGAGTTGLAPSLAGEVAAPAPTFTRHDAEMQGLHALATGHYDPTQGLDALRRASEAVAHEMSQMQDAPGPVNLPKFQIQGKVTRADVHAVELARAYLGTPYVWGGATPKGFDCSGLLQFIWSKSGVNIPRTTYQQFQTGMAVGKGGLRPGDAVFFRGSDSKNGLPGHVGIYIGGGRFIEAPHTGSTVHVSTLRGRTDYMGARRYG